MCLYDQHGAYVIQTWYSSDFLYRYCWTFFLIKVLLLNSKQNEYFAMSKRKFILAASLVTVYQWKTGETKTCQPGKERKKTNLKNNSNFLPCSGYCFSRRLLLPSTQFGWSLGGLPFCPLKPGAWFYFSPTYFLGCFWFWEFAALQHQGKSMKKGNVRIKLRWEGEWKSL